VPKLMVTMGEPSLVHEMILGVVFKSLVKSGFLTPKGATVDCN